MTAHNFKLLMAYAQSYGMKTLGELQRYKESRGIASNNELLRSLYFDSLKKAV